MCEAGWRAACQRREGGEGGACSATPHAGLPADGHEGQRGVAVGGGRHCVEVAGSEDVTGRGAQERAEAGRRRTIRL